ncbi:MAG: hypothetical protein JXB32_22340 [Deltaproteobacteria bacterium]|nr:hypothetical protein [Deltaproteobacteria bacterium]
MKPRLHDVFERLEPPPGGLARLRARMAEAERPRTASPLRPLAWVAAAAAAASLVVVAALAAREGTVPRPGPVAAAPVPAPTVVIAAAPPARLPGFHPAFAALGLEPLPSEPVTVSAETAASLALQRVPLEDDRVVFYLVATVQGSRSACQNGSDSSGRSGWR